MCCSIITSPNIFPWGTGTFSLRQLLWYSWDKPVSRNLCVFSTTTKLESPKLHLVPCSHVPEWPRLESWGCEHGILNRLWYWPIWVRENDMESGPCFSKFWNEYITIKTFVSSTGAFTELPYKSSGSSTVLDLYFILISSGLFFLFRFTTILAQSEHAFLENGPFHKHHQIWI